MADQKEDHLSPEEKLLRVIQGEGQKRKAGGGAAPAAEGAPTKAVAAPVSATAVASATTPAPSPAPATPTTVAGRGSEKRSLKVADKDAVAAVGEDAVTASPAESSKAAEKALPAKAAVMAKRTSSESDLSVRALNIVLAVFVLIVILLTGREILANVKTSDINVQIGEVSLPEAGTQDAERDLQQLDTFLDALDVRFLFAAGVEAPQLAPAPPPPPPPSDYCKLYGISVNTVTSEKEALVMDNKINKMLYLKVGDGVSSEGQPWTMTEIQSDRVIFKNGSNESVVQ